MKKIILNPDDIQGWMRDSWGLYASDSVNDKLLRLWINHLIEYKIEYDGIRMYQGSRMRDAIEAWEDVI